MTLPRMHVRNSLILSACLSLLTPAGILLPASAATSKSKSQPAGTLLLPLTPKIDDSVGSDGAPKSTAPSTAAQAPPPPKPLAATKQAPAQQSAPSATAQSTQKSGDGDSDEAPSAVTKRAEVESDTAVEPSQPPQQNISAEMGREEDATSVDENSLLKGTVQLIADDTEYDQEKNTFLGTGNAVAIIAGQNSKLEADTILYDQANEIIDARGNVKILRDGQLTTGTAFKFKVTSDEYLITDPDTEVQGTNVIARNAKGTNEGILFRKGTFTLPHPVVLLNNYAYGPQTAAEQAVDWKQHPEAYVPQHPSFKFVARKMTYEKYKEDGNLTVYGGKLKFEHFTLPLGKFTANVGTDSRVVFPVTPSIGNNMMVGGINAGPSFNYSVGKTGVFSWAPLLQYGGKSTTSSGINDNKGKLGAGFKLAYSSDRLAAHLGYGSNSNLLVGDIKYKMASNTYYQAGVNRFLSDGMFGVRRARLLSEVYDIRTVTKIPYISMVQFRTSAGWAQDNPNLVNLSGSQYSQLFTQTHTGKVSAYKYQEQITASTHPLISVGNDKYGAKLNFFAGAAFRAYSTGDRDAIGQVGPAITANLGKLRLQGGYAQSKVQGTSPFVFDEFIQGSKSTFLNGDVKLAKWLTLGTSLGYNLDAKLMYSRAITAAVGPEDFKILARYDQISGYNRVGLNVIYGQPVAFNKLLMKQHPDAGQTGGI